MMIYSQVSLEAFPPLRLSKTSFAGIDTDPRLMLSIKSNPNPKIRNTKKIVFRLECCTIEAFRKNKFCNLEATPDVRF